MMTKFVVRVGLGLSIAFYLSAISIASELKSVAEVEKVMSLESDPDYGAYLVSECLTCHSETSANGAIPKIHGQEKAYIAKALLEYKYKERENEVMRGITSALTNDDIAALSTFLSQE